VAGRGEWVVPENKWLNRKTERPEQPQGNTPSSKEARVVKIGIAVGWETYGYTRGCRIWKHSTRGKNTHFVSKITITQSAKRHFNPGERKKGYAKGDYRAFGDRRKGVIPTHADRGSEKKGPDLSAKRLKMAENDRKLSWG